MTRRVHRRMPIGRRRTAASRSPRTRSVRWNAFGAQQAEVDTLLQWLEEWQDVPRAQQLHDQLSRAASVNQREKVAKKIIDFMISLQADPDMVREMAGYAEEAAREEVSAINTALILGGLGVGESGLVEPMAEPPPPARTEPTPHLRATQRRRAERQRQATRQAQPLQRLYQRAVRAIHLPPHVGPDPRIDEWRRIFNRMPENPAEEQLQEAAEMLMAGPDLPVYWLVGYHTTSIARRAAYLPMPEEFVEEALMYHDAGVRRPSWHQAGEAPFRVPHHTVSLTGMTGRYRDGTFRPGEIHLAHGGVLFLDTVLEFTRGVLQAVAGAWTNKGMNYRSGDETFHTDTNFTLILATSMNDAQSATAAEVRRVLDVFTNVSVIPVGIGELPAAWLGQQ